MLMNKYAFCTIQIYERYSLEQLTNIPWDQFYAHKIEQCQFTDLEGIKKLGTNKPVSNFNTIRFVVNPSPSIR